MSNNTNNQTNTNSTTKEEEANAFVELANTVAQIGLYKPKQVPKTPDEYPTATQLKKKWQLERRGKV